MNRELLQQALEALEGVFEGESRGAEYWTVNGGTYEAVTCMQAIRSLRQAIEQAEKQAALDKKADNARELGLDYEPEQEPVAVWELQEGGWDTIADADWMETLPIGTKLYALGQSK